MKALYRLSLHFSSRYFDILAIACNCLVALEHISLICIAKFRSLSINIPRTFSFVSIGISMLETMKLVGTVVNLWGITIPWNFDGLASISLIVNKSTAMAHNGAHNDVIVVLMPKKVDQQYGYRWHFYVLLRITLILFLLHHPSTNTSNNFCYNYFTCFLCLFSIPHETHTHSLLGWQLGANGPMLTYC